MQAPKTPLLKLREVVRGARQLLMNDIIWGDYTGHGVQASQAMKLFGTMRTQINALIEQKPNAVTKEKMKAIQENLNYMNSKLKELS